MLPYSEAIREVDHRVKTFGKEKNPLVASPARTEAAKKGQAVGFGVECEWG